MRAGRVVAVALLVLAASMVFSAGALAAPGNYDRSFGAGGVIQAGAGSPSFNGGSHASMATGPQGTTYLLRCPGFCAEGVVVTRFLKTGQVDSTYGNGGSATVLAGVRGTTEATALAVDSEGRAVIADVLVQGLVVVRLTPDGSLDPSFGGGVGGRVECGCVGVHVAVDGAGRVVVDGRSSLVDHGEGPYALPTLSTLFFLRLGADGLPDPSFGDSGRTIVSLEGNFTPEASLVQSDSGIVIAGRKLLRGVLTPFALRIEPNGSFQRTYGAALMQGPFIKRFNGISATALIGRPNGVRVLGETGSGGYVLALGAQGKVNHRFGQRGVRLLPWRVQSAVADQEGRITGVGTGKNGSSDAFRLLANGTLDLTFNGGRGVLLAAATEETSVLSSEVVMAEGERPTFRVVTAGFCRFSCSGETRLIRLRGGSANTRCRGKIATIVGTVAGDRLIGTLRRDVIAALGGADVVYGRGGNDLICGGAGSDRLHGGPGRDRIVQ
jgi:uncharacterized delta-60 repeat protein